MAKVLQRFLQLPEVVRATGLPRSTIYGRISAGSFPRPVHEPGTRRSLWIEAEIIEWQVNQITMRDAKKARRRAA